MVIMSPKGNDLEKLFKNSNTKVKVLFKVHFCTKAWKCNFGDGFGDDFRDDFTDDLIISEFISEICSLKVPWSPPPLPNVLQG